MIKKQIDLLNSRWFQIDIWEFYSYIFAKWRTKDGINKYDIADYLFKNSKNIENAKILNDNTEIETEEFYQKFLKNDEKNSMNL